MNELTESQLLLLNNLVASGFFNKQFIERYTQAIYFLYPTIKQLIKDHFDGRPVKILEIGCGTGPKVAALSSLAENYTGIEIDPISVKEGNNNLKKLNIKNSEILLKEANDIENVLASKSYDLYICYAVLEHLTLEERDLLLKSLWSAISTGGIIYIGEAPNLLSPIDYHSSKLPYFNKLPIEMQKELYHESKIESWKQRISSESSLEKGLFRNGCHVSFYDFHRSIMPVSELSDYIITDNFDLNMLKMDPLRSHEIALLHELSHLKHHRYLQVEPRWDIPRVFARYWINFAISRSKVRSKLQYPTIKSLPENFSPNIFYDRFANRLIPIGGKNEAWYSNDGVNCEYIILCLDSERSFGSIEITDEAKVKGTIIDIDNVKSNLINYWTPHLYLKVNLKIEAGKKLCISSKNNKWFSLIYVMFFN